MARNDNLLDAPASGFGQNVSFATSPNTRETPSLDGVGGRARSSGGIQGSPINGALPRAYTIEAPPPDPTMAFLMKAGAKVLESKLKEERAKAFVTGMQRAASGEAIKDIVESEPWYAKVFGEADVIEGARVYTAQAKAAEAAGAIEDSMAEVRTMNPDQANEFYSKLVAKQMTGDPATDAALMQGFSRMLPATMRRQAKEHFAWKQEQASAAESKALLSAAALLQKRMAYQGPVQPSEEEADLEAVQLVASMRPAQGRDLESWTKARTNDLLELARNNQFHAVNIIKQAGMLELLDPAQRTKIETALDSAESRLVATKAVEYADELGAIAGQSEVYSTDLDPAAQFERIKQLNDNFKRTTGIDRDFITLDRASGIVKDAHVTILREGERRIREAETKAASAADKAQAQQIRLNGAIQAIGLGQAGLAKQADGMGDVVDEQFRNGMRALMNQDPSAAAKVMALNFNGAGSGIPYVNKDLVHQFESRTLAAVGNQMPQDFQRLFTEYDELFKVNPAMADAYFGKYAKRMELFRNGLDLSKPPGSRGEAESYAYAFAGQEPKPATFDKKEWKQVNDLLAKQHTARSGWSLWKAQREPIREDQMDLVQTQLGDYVRDFAARPGVSLEQATQRALALAQRERGFDMLGGFAVMGQKGQAPLTALLLQRRPGDPATGTSAEDLKDTWDESFRKLLKVKAGEVGADLSEQVSVFRLPDDQITVMAGNEKRQYSVARMHVVVRTEKGNVPLLITSDDIKNFARDPNRRSGGGPITQ